jgi:predicted DNA-binding protein (MmcQ/YjbR family)
MFWAALETEDALPRAEIKRLITQAYQLVFAKLPKKTQAALSVPVQVKKRSTART